VSLLKVAGMKAIPIPFEQAPIGLESGAINLTENNSPAKSVVATPPE
jgi:hypothetical protein